MNSVIKNHLYIIALVFLFTSCNKEKKSSVKPMEEAISKTISQDLTASKGYKLMEQKCFICHFPKPDPSKRDQMLAPPMLRVQEHYKPLYPNKEDFVKAVTNWVLNPTEDKVEMPGTVRKWGLMPKLGYSNDDVKLISEVIYDMDFGKSPKMHGNNEQKTELKLNNGKKWKLDAKAIKTTTIIIESLKNFKSDDVTAYHNLGKKVFSNAKSLLLNKSVTDDKLEQLQAFFHNTEGNMHQMMQVKTVEEGKKQQTILKKKFSKFLDFFE